MATTTRSRVSEGIDGKDAVGLYLEGIAKTPLLSAEEEVELAKTIEIGLYAEHVLSGEVTLAERGKHAKRPTKAELELLVEEGRRAMQHFVTANLRLVVSVARKYGRSQMPLLDLVQEGNTGLIRAVEKFDYTKGFKFSTYGTWWVRQSISRGIAQQGRIVRLPVHVAEQVNQVGAVRRTLERRLGRDPEIEEIAAEYLQRFASIAEKCTLLFALYDNGVLCEKCFHSELAQFNSQHRISMIAQPEHIQAFAAERNEYAAVRGKLQLVQVLLQVPIYILLMKSDFILLPAT